MSGREPRVLLVVGAIALAVSGVAPHDRLTWLLEVAPILIAVPVLIATARRFPLTPLAYRLIFLHALILMLGGGHLAQGFVPAIVVREILIRRSPLRPGKWLAFLVVCVCLAISAAYELIEWWSALIGGESADAFLGTQGDQWDTQWDMFTALVGAVAALALLGRYHDRQIARLEAQSHG